MLIRPHIIPTIVATRETHWRIVRLANKEGAATPTTIVGPVMSLIA